MGANIEAKQDVFSEKTNFNISRLISAYNAPLTIFVALIALITVSARFISGNTGSLTEWSFDSNLDIFTLVTSLSLIVIIITSFGAMVFKQKNIVGYEMSSMQRHFQLIGTFGVYLGFMLYYSGYILEPIIIYYSFILITVYKGVITFVEPNYMTYIADPSLDQEFYRNMPWDPRTVSVIKEFGQFSQFDAYIGILLFLWFILLFISLKNPKELFSEKTRIYFRENRTLKLSGNILLALIGVIYFFLWLKSSSFEGLGLQLFLLAIVLRYGLRVISMFSNPRTIRYIIRRILIIFPTFIGITIVVYLLMSLTGSPLDLFRTSAGQVCRGNITCVTQYLSNLSAQFGVNAPIQIQWLNWLLQFSVGSMGRDYSYLGNLPVSQEFVNRVIPTLELAIFPTIISLLISIPLGMIAAKREYSVADTGINMFISVGVAFPTFLGLILAIAVFADYIPILPSSGRTFGACGTIIAPYPECLTNSHSLYTAIYLNSPLSPVLQFFIAANKWDWMFHMIIPSFVLAILGLALYTRLIRGGMLEVMRQDYIMSARASGFSERTIENKYALRNVMIPVITYLGLAIGFLLAGAPITETVMNWPGLGIYGLRAITLYVYPAVMATTMIVALMVMIANLLTDIMYSLIDPRIQVA